MCESANHRANRPSEWKCHPQTNDMVLAPAQDLQTVSEVQLGYAIGLLVCKETGMQ
jgi:hypothetical protein